MIAPMQKQPDTTPELDQLCINTIRTLRSMQCKKPNQDIRACRSARLPWLTCCGRDSCVTIPEILDGKTAIDFFFRPGTARC